MVTVSYINDATALASFCDAASQRSALMIDTEFLRERTFFPVLCLVQIASDDMIALIDPLAVDDMEALWAMLFTKKLVLHAARQDVEVLQQASGRLPSQIFDTQIAAAFCGYPAQIGYANLVQDLTGVSLAKTHTRTDWSRRPLRPGELEYAADDVRYLGQVTDSLAARLEDLGRTAWAEEDSALQLRPALYTEPAGDAWRRVKGMSRLRNAAHRRGQSLAAWRERVAIERNLPRRWVIKDLELVAIAEANPQTPDELHDLLPSKKSRSRYGAAIVSALANTSESDSSWQPPERPDAEQKATVKRLGTVVQAAAESLEISAELIAPQKELKAVAAGDTALRVFSGWRDKLIGDALRAVLD